MGINLNAAAGDKAGNCYAGGGFAGELEFGGDVLTSHYDPAVRYTPWGLTDAVILKYDVRGKPLWARRGIGGPKSDYVQGIAAKPDGGIVVAGDFMGIGDFGKFRLALPSPEPTSAQGRYILPPRGVFAATLSSDGEILHALQNVPEENGRPTGISVTGDGDVYITGTQDWAATYGRTRAPNSGINAFLARLSGL
jgi:hypothetical protein